MKKGVARRVIRALKQEAQSPRFCIDCRHVEFAHGQDSSALCRREPQFHPEVDLVTGRKSLVHRWCDAERQDTNADTCGTKGKYFEARE